MNQLKTNALLDYLRVLVHAPGADKVMAQERMNRTCDAIEKELEIEAK